MQRFILQQNRDRFVERLRIEADPKSRATIETLLRAVERDLAFLEASFSGAGYPARQQQPYAIDDKVVVHFRARTLGSPKLGMAIDPGPGLHIVDVNETFVRESLRDRDELIGRPLFDTFPDNPQDPMADGVSALYALLRTAAISREAQVMPEQRYDVHAPDGTFVERRWRVVNTPIFDRDDRLAYLLQETERLEETEGS